MSDPVSTEMMKVSEAADMVSSPKDNAIKSEVTDQNQSARDEHSSNNKRDVQVKNSSHDTDRLKSAQTPFRAFRHFSYTSNQVGQRCQQPDQSRGHFTPHQTLSLFFHTRLHENSVTVNVKHKPPGGSAVTCGIQDAIPCLAKLFLKRIICPEWNDNGGARLCWWETCKCGKNLKWSSQLVNLMYSPWETLKRRIYWEFRAAEITFK